MQLRMVLKVRRVVLRLGNQANQQVHVDELDDQAREHGVERRIAPRKTTDAAQQNIGHLIRRRADGIEELEGIQLGQSIGKVGVHGSGHEAADINSVRLGFNGQRSSERGKEGLSTTVQCAAGSREEGSLR